MSAMDSDDLIQRARERCAGHLPAKGMCHECFRAELEEMLLDENPDMRCLHQQSVPALSATTSLSSASP